MRISTSSQSESLIRNVPTNYNVANKNYIVNKLCYLTTDEQDNKQFPAIDLTIKVDKERKQTVFFFALINIDGAGLH